MQSELDNCSAHNTLQPAASMLITASTEHIWEFFSTSSWDSKYALCLTCDKKLEVGIELTASMKAPNLKHHLRTVHPDLYITLKQKSKQNKPVGRIKSARGESSNDGETTEKVKKGFNFYRSKDSELKFAPHHSEDCQTAGAAKVKSAQAEGCVECGGSFTPGERRLRRSTRGETVGEGREDVEDIEDREDMEWHLDCFKCRHCSCSLAGQGFSWRQNLPYCLQCLTLLFSKSCQRCPHPIRGDVSATITLLRSPISESGGGKFISLNGRFWHNQCFLCSGCSENLADRGFIAEGEDILCEGCAQYLYA